MGRPRQIDPKRAARIIVDARVLGPTKTAQKWEISKKTVRRYLEREREDPELSALVHLHEERIDKGWHAALQDALIAAAKRAKDLVADERDLDKVTNFIEKTAGVDVTREALGVGAELDPEGARVAAAASADRPSEARPLPH